MNEKEVVRDYYAPSPIDRVKFDPPERARGKRFKSNVPNSHIWHLDKLVKCQKLMIIKSMKDLLGNTDIFPCTAAVGNESSSIFTPEVVEMINKKAKRVF